MLGGGGMGEGSEGEGRDAAGPQPGPADVDAPNGSAGHSGGVDIPAEDGGIATSSLSDQLQAAISDEEDSERGGDLLTDEDDSPVHRRVDMMYDCSQRCSARGPWGGATAKLYSEFSYKGADGPEDMPLMTARFHDQTQDSMCVGTGPDGATEIAIIGLKRPRLSGDYDSDEDDSDEDDHPRGVISLYRFKEGGEGEIQRDTEDPSQKSESIFGLETDLRDFWRTSGDTEDFQTLTKMAKKHPFYDEKLRKVNRRRQELELLTTCDLDFEVHSFARSPCGNFLAAGGDEGVLSLHRIVRVGDSVDLELNQVVNVVPEDTGEPLSFLEESAAMNNSVRFGIIKGKTRIIVASQDTFVYVLDLPSRDTSCGSGDIVCRSLQGADGKYPWQSPERAVNSDDYLGSAEPRHLYWSSNPREAYEKRGSTMSWKSGRTDAIGPFPEAVNCAEVSPDGNWLAAVMDSHTIWVVPLSKRSWGKVREFSSYNLRRYDFEKYVRQKSLECILGGRQGVESLPSPEEIEAQVVNAEGFLLGGPWDLEVFVKSRSMCPPSTFEALKFDVRRGGRGAWHHFDGIEALDKSWVDDFVKCGPKKSEHGHDTKSRSFHLQRLSAALSTVHDIPSHGCQYVAWNPSSTLLAVSSDSLQTVNVFDVERHGCAVARFPLHNGPCLSLSFAPWGNENTGETLVWAQEHEKIHVALLDSYEKRPSLVEWDRPYSESYSIHRYGDKWEDPDPRKFHFDSSRPFLRINGLGITPEGQVLIGLCDRMVGFRLLRRWSPESHSVFPTAFQAAVQPLLLGSSGVASNKCGLAAIPSSILHSILEKAAFPLAPWLLRGKPWADLRSGARRDGQPAYEGDDVCKDETQELHLEMKEKERCIAAGWPLAFS